MSTHSVPIIEITEVRQHANAERLEIVPVNGWQAVTKKGQFAPGDRAIYIEPDYTVPTTRPEFSFLAKEGKDRHRLKAIRLRGVLSYGLLIPVPETLQGAPIGTDVMGDLDIKRYEPPVVMGGADELPADECPNAYASKFDIESLQNFSDILVPGEEVIVTEKIDGANARYLFQDGIFYMGSRTRWLKPDVAHIWKRAADSVPGIRAWCEAHPGVVLYGEVYGSVQSLKYGTQRGEVRFAAFAASLRGDWLPTEGLLGDETLPTAPVLYTGPYRPEDILPLAEQDSTLAPAGHMREGIVIVPVVERRDERLGRVALKHISNRFWESEA